MGAGVRILDLCQARRAGYSSGLPEFDCGLVVTSPDGRRTRYELADERLGTALDDLRSAVVAVETDRTCPDAETRGCC
ncbi:hypothetical protein GCM10010221_21960 [Streptomyces parvus]|nr:hypothetical protein GCM10010221_21960 [Streptomyces parvus]